jgi:hypothetical protein
VSGWVATLVATGVATGPAQSKAQDARPATAPETAVAPVAPDATKTVNAPAGSSATAPATPGTKLNLEQVRAAMAAAEKNRQELLKPDPNFPKALTEKWGVEVIGINLTSAGYMLDFRFRVVDAEKALPLFDHRIKPFLVAEKSALKLPVPMAAKVGAFRPTNRGKNIKADKNYYMIFANPDSYVKQGEKVSVVIGDFRADNLTVQ